MDIRIVRGTPGDDELAALVAVLASPEGAPPGAAPQPAGRPGWLDANTPSGRFTVTGSWSSTRRNRHG